MKLNYRTRNGRYQFQLEGEDVQALFRQVAEIQETFETDEICGCCGSPEIHLRVRTVTGGFEYFELACNSCDAYLTFGQKKDGGFWPKRQGENNGWRVWVAEPQDFDDPRLSSTRRPAPTRPAPVNR